MLYDQGQLLSFYAELSRRAHDAEDLTWPIRETVAYLRREMRAESGAWYASQDADSEGEEGKFFVWTPEPDRRRCSATKPIDFCAALWRAARRATSRHGTTQLVDEARAPRAEGAEAARSTPARRARSERIPPATDPKHVAAWNGYTISGLARAATTLGDAAMLEDAVTAADFVFDEMFDAEGRLLRVHNEGRAHITGFLDDHAALLVGCLDLQRAGAGDRFLERARALAEAILARFADRGAGILYLSPAENDGLIHRPRAEHDGATPDASGLALLGLARLAALAEDVALDGFVERAFAEQAAFLERAPHAFPTLLRAVALRARGVAVAVIVGDAERPETQALAERARRVLRPEDAVIVHAPGQALAPGVAPTWLLGREAIDGRPTAYLCAGRVCSLPVQDPAELIADLVPTPAP